MGDTSATDDTESTEEVKVLRKVAETFKRSMLVAVSGGLLASMVFTTWVTWGMSRIKGCQCGEVMRVEAKNYNEVHVDGASQYDKTVREMADKFTTARIEQEKNNE